MSNRYAGGLGARNFAGPEAEQKIAEQAVVASLVIKAWQSERQAEIKKYSRAMGTLKRASDGINELIVLKGPLSPNEMTAFEGEFNARAEVANELMKGLVEDYRQKMLKAGVTTSLGYNFFDLRGPAYLVYPVNVPFRNMLPRWGAVNAGVGTKANWKYGNAPGTSYSGAAEGKRVAFATPPETDVVATYKELGIERAVTFTAQFAGAGYTDNVSDEHLRGMHELWLQEESEIIGGNSGTGTGLNGFLLGTAATPTGTAVAGSVFTTAHWISAYVVELTMLGNPNNAQYGYQAAPTVSGGLTPSFTRTNADGTTDTIKGGMGQISAGSTPVQVSGSNLTVAFKVAASKGAFAWAWFIDDEASNTSVAANAKLAAITTVPTFTPAAAAAGTQAANFSGSASDNSAQALDFDGIIAWAANAGVFINMSDITKNDASQPAGTANDGLLDHTVLGQVDQLEYDLLQQWNAFQTVGDTLWASADAKISISKALMVAGSVPPAYRFEYSRDGQGQLLGGFVVSGYKSQYSMKATGSDEIPIRIHPMLPPGTYILHKETNPYPHSRIPGVSGLFVQRDYYGIEWPVTTRLWTFGEYVHETYANYIPGLLTVRTGIAGVN